MRPSRFKRFLLWLIDKIPPRGRQIEVWLCDGCGKIRLQGEIRTELWRAPCPKCGSLRVKAPKPHSLEMLFKLLLISIFRRKDLLYGLDEGLHMSFRHEGQPKTPNNLEDI